MDKEIVSGIVRELSHDSVRWPEPIQEQINRVQSMLAQYSPEQFERMTDGAVTTPATENPVSPDDPALAVNELHAALTDYASRNRKQKDEQLESWLNRLGAQVDTYERDFP
ncbi:hypothetical protein AB6A23_12310 [Paenibacillus tarimensis]